MPADKRIFFMSGLPRSGSTLLANILAQHPRIHVTPTSGICDMLVQVRNGWDANDAFRAMHRHQSEQVKENVLRAILQGYFAHVDKPVCIDSSGVAGLRAGLEACRGKALLNSMSAESERREPVLALAQRVKYEIVDFPGGTDMSGGVRVKAGGVAGSPE